jgi:hypothetical protein
VAELRSGLKVGAQLSEMFMTTLSK